MVSSAGSPSSPSSRFASGLVEADGGQGHGTRSPGDRDLLAGLRLDRLSGMHLPAA